MDQPYMNQHFCLNCTGRYTSLKFRWTLFGTKPLHKISCMYLNGASWMLKQTSTDTWNWALFWFYFQNIKSIKTIFFGIGLPFISSHLSFFLFRQDGSTFFGVDVLFGLNSILFFILTKCKDKKIRTNRSKLGV